MLSLLGFKKSEPDRVDDTLPTESQLSNAHSQIVLDSSGTQHALSSIIASRRTLVTFVRHHHCGMCHEFVRTLSNDLYLSSTAGTKEGPQVIVIGHGEWKGIEMYQERSGCKFEMYVDEGKNVYRALGMTRRYLGQVKGLQKPGYLQGLSTKESTWRSIKQTLADGYSAFTNGGEVDQLGGDFVFDEQGKCIFAHRMQTTTDHTDIPKLVALLKGEDTAKADGV